MSVSPILLVGAGGIASPLAIALAEAGVPQLTVIDEDKVEPSNLHRQLLFRDDDVGRPKLDAFKDALARRYPHLQLHTIAGRALPSNVLDLTRAARLVLDATDNFASRFLLADACHLTKTPIVHAAAVRWLATVMAVSPEGGPCYRCLFEDIPTGDAPDCATAGVMGPICGIAASLAADRALRIQQGDTTAFGHITSYDGWNDRLRRVAIPPRADCALCGPDASIAAIDPNRYDVHCHAST